MGAEIEQVGGDDGIELRNESIASGAMSKREIDRTTTTRFDPESFFSKLATEMVTTLAGYSTSSPVDPAYSSRRKTAEDLLLKALRAHGYDPLTGRLHRNLLSVVASWIPRTWHDSHQSGSSWTGSGGVTAIIFGSDASGYSSANNTYGPARTDKLISDLAHKNDARLRAAFEQHELSWTHCGLRIGEVLYVVTGPEWQVEKLQKDTLPILLDAQNRDIQEYQVLHPNGAVSFFGSLPDNRKTAQEAGFYPRAGIACVVLDGTLASQLDPTAEGGGSIGAVVDSLSREVENQVGPVAVIGVQPRDLYNCHTSPRDKITVCALSSAATMHIQRIEQDYNQIQEKVYRRSLLLNPGVSLASQLNEALDLNVSPYKHYQSAILTSLSPLGINDLTFPSLVDANWAGDAVELLRRESEKQCSTALAPDESGICVHPGHIFGIDVGNLRGLNDMLGRDGANKVVKALLQQAVINVHREIDEIESKKRVVIQVQLVRAGGDEILGEVLSPTPMALGEFTSIVTTIQGAIKEAITPINTFPLTVNRDCIELGSKINTVEKELARDNGEALMDSDIYEKAIEALWNIHIATSPTIGSLPHSKVKMYPGPFGVQLTIGDAVSCADYPSSQEMVYAVLDSVEMAKKEKQDRYRNTVD